MHLYHYHLKQSVYFNSNKKYSMYFFFDPIFLSPTIVKDSLNIQFCNNIWYT